MKLSQFIKVLAKGPVKKRGQVTDNDLDATVRKIFTNAGFRFTSKDTIIVKKLATGKKIEATTNTATISYKSLLRLTAYISHRFKTRDFNVTSVNTLGKPTLKVSFVVKEIKKDKNGNHKVERSRKKNTSKSRVRSKAELRISAHLNNTEK